MSSMRNAVQRRNHKERAQPVERERYGILEKHKDYSLRAKDFASKKSRLRALRQKAADRNPDEFSFSMMSSRTNSSGVRIGDRGNRPLSHDVVKLLKTQDVGYVRTMLQKTRKERERAEQEVQILDQHDEDGEREASLRVLRNEGILGKGSHTMFVDSKEEQIGFKPKERFSTDQEGLKRSYNQKILEEAGMDQDEADIPLQNGRIADGRETFDRTERRWIQRSKESRRKHVEALKARERDLMMAEQELDLQRAKMNNTITSGVNKNGVKFKIRERKR